MKLFFFIFLLSLTSTLIESQTISINKENASKFNNGKFQGFGSSFCWWPNRLGYDDTLADASATAFYDKKEGLGLTIIRYNIGGGDDPSHKHITRTDSELPGYWSNPKYDGNTKEYSWEYDWNQDFNQRNVLLKSLTKNREEIIVEAFSNSPPYFMTNSGCSSGSVDGGSNNLKNDAYPAFAKYLAEVSAHFKSEWNVHFQSIAPMNEPYTNFWHAFSDKQEGCHFDQGQCESNILIELKKALDKVGLTDVIISASDETSIDTQIDSYNRLTDEAKKIVQRIDTHTYGGSKRNELRILAENVGKNLWMSEIDGGGAEGCNAGEMGAALWLANRIIIELNEFRSSAWILWQLIDNHISKDGYKGKKDKGMVDLNKGYWGVAVADHDAKKIILTQKYYAFGQFSRYIRPGYTIISGSPHSLAAYDSVGKQLVIVATNGDCKDNNIEFDLSSFTKVGTNVKVIRTSGTVSQGEHWTELPNITAANKKFTASIKSNSVTTYIVEGVEY